MTIPAQIIDGRYEILGPLGKGGQGEAWKARDLFQGEVVALKLMAGTMIGPWHEAAALTALRDDHILPIRNADLASGTPYLVTELAENGTVFDRIEGTRLAGIEPATAIRWTRQVCQALMRTHDARLLHTDVKPENLFLDEHDNVRLGDYGLASFVDALGLGHTSGTAQTLAPEVARAMVNQQARGTSVRSDIYSAAATLYWMLAAVPAFQPAAGKGVAASAHDIVGHVPSRLGDLAPHLPLVLVQRVEKAMSLKAEDRYATAGDFAAALGSLPSQSRVWVRTDEDPGHHGCWRGTGAQGAVILVCALRKGARVSVGAVKLPHRRVVRGAGGESTPSRLAPLLRATFKALA